MAREEARNDVQPKDEVRRNLLKAATVAGGAVAASALLPGSWEKPVATIGGLPAHAQTSGTITDYFVIQAFTDASLPPTAATAPGPPGPRAIQVTVDPVTEIAHVVANNRFNDMRLGIELEIGGTPSNAFTVLASSCLRPVPSAEWNVEGYTLGDPTIKIASSGEASWVVEVPMGNGILPDLDACSG